MFYATDVWPSATYCWAVAHPVKKVVRLTHGNASSGANAVHTMLVPIVGLHSILFSMSCAQYCRF